jgi:hypothetical protein
MSRNEELDRVSQINNLKKKDILAGSEKNFENHLSFGNENKKPKLFTKY